VNCSNCKDTAWVCEEHHDKPWDLDGVTCCAGAGMPCSACNVADANTVPRALTGSTEIWNIHKGWIN
jgi:hypothetical protein